MKVYYVFLTADMGPNGWAIHRLLEVIPCDIYEVMQPDGRVSEALAKYQAARTPHLTTLILRKEPDVNPFKDKAEELTDQERAELERKLEQAQADIRAGRVRSWAEVRRELGIRLEDD